MRFQIIFIGPPLLFDYCINMSSLARQPQRARLLYVGLRQISPFAHTPSCTYLVHSIFYSFMVARRRFCPHTCLLVSRDQWRAATCLLHGMSAYEAK
jgi:hypothetical protein